MDNITQLTYSVNKPRLEVKLCTGQEFERVLTDECEPLVDLLVGEAAGRRLLDAQDSVPQVFADGAVLPKTTQLVHCGHLLEEGLHGADDEVVVRGDDDVRDVVLFAVRFQQQLVPVAQRVRRQRQPVLVVSTHQVRDRLWLAHLVRT